MDKTQKIGLATMKVGMGKLYGLRISVGTDETLLEGRYLAKAIEIELSDEGREVLVFEPFPEDFTSKSFLVEDYATVLVSEYGPYFEYLGHVP